MKITDICNIISGGTPKTSEPTFWNGSIPWISIKDFVSMNRYVISTEKYITEEGLNKSATNLLHKGDIIISARGTVGSVALINKPMAFNQSCYGLRCKKEKVLSEYLFYWLKANKKYICSNTHGAVFDTITINTLQETEIDLPNLSLQQHIVDTIGSVDNLIEKNEEIIKKINSILDIKFTDIFKKSNKSVLIGRQNLYISDFVANGSFKALKDNTEILDNEDFAYFLRNTDLKENNFNKYVSKSTYDFLKKSSIQGHEILISNVGDVGSVYLCPILDKPMTLGNNMILITNENREQNYYLYLLFKSEYGQYLLNGITGGSAQQKFNKTDLRKLEIKMCDEDKIKEFNKECSILYSYLDNIQAQLNKLKQSKEILLKKYFG